MRGFRVFAAVLVILCLSIGVASAAETIKIGMLAPLTGFAAADGASALNSVKIAVDQVNGQGGVLGKKIQLIVYDDRADAKEAVALAYKLIEQDKIAAFVAGSYSLPTRAVAPIFQEEKIPLVAAYAIHPDVTKAGEYCFRNGFLGTVEGKAAAYTAHKLLNAKTVALLTSDNDFGRTLVEGFKMYQAKYGKDMKIVYEQAYPFSEKDFKPYLSKIKEANPDVIFASGYYFQTGPLLKQARELGIKSKILGEEGADSPKLAEIAGEAAEGFYIVTNFDRDDPRPVVQNFLKEYRKRYKIEPDMVGASAYDAFMIIVDAMRKTKTYSNPTAIRMAISKTTNFDGLTGIIKGFTHIGEVVKPVQVQVVKNGLFRRFGVVDDPELIRP
ncbi:MAG: ABC transporter substrate-binding protein [Synergistaceae bacterium]|jgi:branched-chain amino acid transport system substrate-binding protein|nr:ABC transporter substrate-binding protein [Synergistaceae bacterium]